MSGDGRTPEDILNPVDEHISDRDLRTPRAAAIAGIVYAVLYSCSYALLLQSVPEISSSGDTGAWLPVKFETVTLALSLQPFAGIAFLWFMAVVRDRLSHLEDQFFSTLFFGAGILYIAMYFCAGAVFGGMVSLVHYYPDSNVTQDLYLSTRSLVYNFTHGYMIRVAGMFMIVLATIWRRTRIMPGWLVALTYLLALGLLFSIGYSPWVVMIFPTWVGLVSAYILLLPSRPGDDRGGPDGMTLE